MNNIIQRKALKEAINLGDTVALHALADLLEEEDDPLAKAMRFIVDHNCRPYMEGWQTYLPTPTRGGFNIWGGVSAHYANSNIPSRVFDQLNNYTQYTRIGGTSGIDTNCWAKYYHSNYEAYIALAQALTGFDTDKEGWK